MATISVAIPNPFAQTALINDKEENIQHCAGHRIRVTGSGNLDTFFYDLDSQTSQQLKPIVMSNTDENEPDTLANFKSQRMMLRVSTNEINEIFNITRILLFVKPLWTDYPR